MFSKLILLLAFLALFDAKSTQKPVGKPTKKPVGTKQPIVPPTKEPVSAPTTKPLQPTEKPSFKPSTLMPTVYIKTSYSKDYPTLDSFVPIDGSSGMYTQHNLPSLSHN